LECGEWKLPSHISGYNETVSKNSVEAANKDNELGSTLVIEFSDLLGIKVLGTDHGFYCIMDLTDLIKGINQIGFFKL